MPAAVLFRFVLRIGVSDVPTKKQLEEADRLASMIDWSKYDNMDDKQVREHWAWDKDMTWPTDEQLAEFDLVIPAQHGRKPPEAAE